MAIFLLNDELFRRLGVVSTGFAQLTPAGFFEAHDVPSLQERMDLPKYRDCYQVGPVNSYKYRVITPLISG